MLAAAPIDPNPLSLLPFATLLLCVAMLPLIWKKHWEHNYHFIATTLAAIAVAYYWIELGRFDRIAHEGFDYVSFMALVGSLFVITGGIEIDLATSATPLTNTLFLALGGLLGNILGTTGASMLLIRPWIRLNEKRYRALHTAFFIFVISNVGGGLTPMGPPLFLGFLKGVPFWWVAKNCWPPWAIAMLGFLVIFFAIDLVAHRHARNLDQPQRKKFRFTVRGRRNFFFLAIVLAAVFINRPIFLREALMLAAGAGAYFATPQKYRSANEFSFAPLREVGWLFLGIFFTMMPVLDFMSLHAREMPLESVARFYWTTGALSSVLDNAPTYLTFLANALGRNGLNVESAQQIHQFLQFGARQVAAISMGAVLFGGLTYIGNSPNFMIKSIAERKNLPTPTFAGFFFKFALPIALPILFVVCWLSFCS